MVSSDFVVVESAGNVAGVRQLRALGGFGGFVLRGVGNGDARGASAVDVAKCRIVSRGG